MGSYKKKPVEAYRWRGESAGAFAKEHGLPEWRVGNHEWLVIPTKDGTYLMAAIGDWIIFTPGTDKYEIYSDAVFKAIYEPIDADERVLEAAQAFARNIMESIKEPSPERIIEVTPDKDATITIHLQISKEV